MSTYYSLICDDHMEITEAVSDKDAGHYCHLGDSGDTLLPFIIYHAECKVRVVSEHKVEYYNGKYKRWNKENVDEMSAPSRKQEIYAAPTSYEDNL